MSESNEPVATAADQQQQPAEEQREPFIPPADLPPDQLFQLAQDFIAGKVYTDRHCPEGMLGSVFLLLGLGAFAGATQEQLAQVGMIYEYLDKAGPRSVNGCPMFLSMRMLSAADVPRLKETCERIRAAVEVVKPQRPAEDVSR